jgi:hypothetical protein
MEMVHSSHPKVSLLTTVFFDVKPHRFRRPRFSKNRDTNPVADIPIRNPAKFPVSWLYK